MKDHLTQNLKKYLSKVLRFKKARAISRLKAQRKTITLTSHQPFYLIPGLRQDGVGIQAMVRLTVMFLAKQTEATYIHIPFVGLGHLNRDYDGNRVSQEEWDAQWESFFNLGYDEATVDQLSRATCIKLLLFNVSLYKEIITSQEALINRISQLRHRRQGVHSFNLEICRHPKECNLIFDQNFIRTIQDKFETGNYKPEKILFSQRYTDIAIHIRRGDVWDKFQAGSTEINYTNKLVSEEHYINLIRSLKTKLDSPEKPIRFHLFSNGRVSDFKSFYFIDGSRAVLYSDDGSSISNIHFHLNINSRDTLYHLIKAPILYPGKSTFSVLAVLLSKGIVVYSEEITDFYQYTLLEAYMNESQRCIPLDRVEEAQSLLLEKCR